MTHLHSSVDSLILLLLRLRTFLRSTTIQKVHFGSLLSRLFVGRSQEVWTCGPTSTLSPCETLEGPILLFSFEKGCRSPRPSQPDVSRYYFIVGHL